MKIVNPLLDWQTKQPQANMNFWYDGFMIGDNPLVLENTKERLVKEGVCLDRLTFMDIREIEEVRTNEILFRENIKVYFRVDLAKVLTAQYIMRTDPQIDYVINSDSDIVAVTCDQLFDHKTMWELKEVGYVFGSAGPCEEENSFIMLSRKLAFDAHEDIMIKKSINEALFHGKKSDQSVFHNYEHFKNKIRIEYEKRTGKRWIAARYKGFECKGKSMIFPASRYGTFGTYSAREIELLKSALL